MRAGVSTKTRRPRRDRVNAQTRAEEPTARGIEQKAMGQEF